MTGVCHSRYNIAVTCKKFFAACVSHTYFHMYMIRVLRRDTVYGAYVGRKKVPETRRQFFVNRASGSGTAKSKTTE